MKKVIPTILIALILVNLFAPFTVGVGRNGAPVVTKSTAEAAYTSGKIEQVKATENYVNIKITLDRQTSDNHGFFYIVTDKQGTTLSKEKFTVGVDARGRPGLVDLSTAEYDLNGLVGEGVADNELTTNTQVFVPAPGAKVIPLPDASGMIPNAQLTGGTAHTVNNKDIVTSVLDRTINLPSPNTTYYISFWFFNGNTIPEGISSQLDNTINTVAVGQTDTTVKDVAAVETTGPDGNLPACWLGVTKGISMSGCIAQLIYYLLFVPTSYLFALTGVFFDSTFAYSVNDASYRSPFVVEGWGLVRDFVNMFFIFVLLYVAFSTILGMSPSKTKGMIVNVILIGLIMNFSLFAGQVIIDASNILARVFYNSNAIKITKGGANGVSSNTPGVDIGPNGELPLSAALVNKVNPQNLIINAQSVGTIPDKAGRSSGETDKSTGVSNGTFILITFLAIAVNIVGMIVFLSVGLIFVARVVGLWIYMILAPFAFFSYTVPSMQGLDMVGWKKWWPEVLSMSFVAPIFIFFLYLILKFLATGLDLIHAGDKTGLQFLIGIVVPFAFIMILLWKAKGIASKMSGALGQQITGAVAAVGGLALGGVALGAAFAGRKTLGAVAKYTQNDGAREKALKFDDTRVAASKIRGLNILNPFAYANVGMKAIAGVGKAATAGVATGVAQIGKKVDPHTGKTTSAFQRQSSRINEKNHATHVLDEKAQAVTGNKDAKYKDLTEAEQKTVQDRVDRDVYSKETYNKNYEGLNAGQKQLVDQKKGFFNPATGQVTYNANGNYAGAALMAQNAAATRGEHLHTAGNMIDDIKKGTAVSEFVNALRKGSYDVRNLSQVKSSSKGMAKFGVGLIAGVAAGVRTGLKNTGINHGSGQSDFLKDMGHTITEAMKSAKITVKVEESHGKSDDEAHGGGGHH